MIAASPSLLSSIPEAGNLHVATITPFFPSLDNPTDGCFVAESLACTASQGVKNTVIAVSPLHHRRTITVAKMPSQRVQYPCVPGNPGLVTAGHFLFRRLYARIRTLHRRQRINLIHAHSALPCGHAAELISRTLNIPFVVTVHGLDAFSTAQVHGLFAQACRRATTRVFCGAQRVICVSRRVQEQVQAGCPDARTTVIHNGVDAELFSPPLTTTPGSTILCVGNLIATKGQDVLLRAFAEVRKKFTDSALQFIGEGPGERILRQLAHQLRIADAVTFHGRKSRETVADAMRSCSVFALPSSYEGLGCVYLEAMSCSKPVIGCRGQGIEEVVVQGRNGYLVRPGDHLALSETITTLLSNPLLREEVGSRARDTVLRSYRLEHQATLMVQAYRGSSQ